MKAYYAQERFAMQVSDKITIKVLFLKGSFSRSTLYRCITKSEKNATRWEFCKKCHKMGILQKMPKDGNFAKNAKRWEFCKKCQKMGILQKMPKDGNFAKNAKRWEFCKKCQKMGILQIFSNLLRGVSAL